MAQAKSYRIGVALVGLLASAFFIWLAMRHIDRSAVVATWHEARPLPWLPLAVLAYLIGHVVRGQRLRVLIRREATLALPTATNVVVVGYASNNVFPARLGELVRGGMLAERTGIPLTQSLTVTFIERLLDGIAILAFFLVSALGLEQPPVWVNSVAKVASLVFGVALTLVLVSVFLPSLVLATAAQIGARFPPAWRDRVISIATSVTSAGAVLRRPRDAAAIIAYSFVVWGFESMMFLFALPVFALKMDPATAVLAMSVTNLGILVPSSPGFVGSFHYFCSQALASQGVAAATALGYAIVVHLTFYIPVTIWGAAVMLWYGVQLGATAAMARAAKASPNASHVQGVPMSVIAQLDPLPEATQKASDFYVAVTEALLAPGVKTDPKALKDAATFVEQEMDLLPPMLRIMFNTGMTGFRFYVRVRYLRGFCLLGLERRQHAVHSWAFGPIGLLRQLFRAPRSAALLAYHEAAAASEISLASVPAGHVALPMERHG